MTASAQRAAEPSMEEILASIRRIIADDQSRTKLTPAKLVSVTDRADSEPSDAGAAAEAVETGHIESDPVEADEAEAGLAEESFASAELPATEPVEAPQALPAEGTVVSALDFAKPDFAKPDFAKPDFPKAELSKANVAELALVRATERDDKEVAEATVQRTAPAASEARANVSHEAVRDGARPPVSGEGGYRSELPRPQLHPAVFSAKVEPVLEAAPAPVAPAVMPTEPAQFAPCRPVAPPLSASFVKPIIDKPVIDKPIVEQPIIDDLLPIDDLPIVEEPAMTELPSAAMSHEPALLPQAVLQPLPQARVEAYSPPLSSAAVDTRPAEPRVEAEPTRQRDASAMLSGEADAAIARAFNSLSRTVLSENARTLEDLVREMLRPMLKAWLDDNLPPLVERLVRAEIERVARGRPV